jgi:hypothetical protein
MVAELATHVLAGIILRLLDYLMKLINRLFKLL